MNQSALPGGPFSLAELASTFPWIPWCEPQYIKVLGTSHSGYACRICIANHGLRAVDVRDLPNDPDKVLDHIEYEHAH